jgi:hypothetical protein
MERFARTIIGYHGCTQAFAHDVLLGRTRIDQWQPSQNVWDWLGHGIYFWEHSPRRALRWAQDHYPEPAVLGAVIQLGRCFDLLDESVTALLAESFLKLADSFAQEGKPLPDNSGAGGKLRKLDCLVINECLLDLAQQNAAYDTVRGAFLEGDPAYTGAGFCRETHIQIAIRNSACLLGVSSQTYSMNSPTAAEIAQEAREALARSRLTPKERFERLVRLGWINRNGEVTKIFGGDVDPEPGMPDPAYANGNGKKRS